MLKISQKTFDPYEKVVAKIFNIYQDELIKANALDFDDLLLHTVSLFKLFPEVLKAYQDKFEYILLMNSKILILSKMN